MCPQVLKPHVYSIYMNGLSCVVLVCVYVFFRFQRPQKPHDFSHTGPPIFCTTGSQQPNSCQPSPATAVVQTLREIAAFNPPL